MMAIMDSFTISAVNLPFISLLLLLTTSSTEFFRFTIKVSSLGVNYGQVANNLPSPEHVVTIINSLKITKTRIYDTNPKILTAFADSGIELIITVPNEMVGVLTDPNQGLQWVQTHIDPFFPSTKITDIAVGNEVYTTDDAALMSNLLPAIVSIHQALVHLNLDRYIHVSTANSLAVLQNSYPPSSGTFKPGIVKFITPLLHFLAVTGTPFWINAYPYFSYKGDPKMVPLDYVLFNPNAGMDDPYTKLHYDNMLYAQVDAALFAMARIGFGELEVRVAETGWPSKGDSDEFGATVENARNYNGNLLARQMKGEGTPLRPKLKLEVYLFALFNENMKPGPTSERNYGLYKPDGTMAYSIGLVSTSASAASVTLASTSDAPPPKFGTCWSWMFISFLIFQYFVSTITYIYVIM